MKRCKKGRLRRGEGFTLLEVLLVLMILIILTSTVSFSVIRAQKTANQRAAQAQMGLFKTMLDAYYVDCGMYPTTDQGLLALRSPPDGLGKWMGPYADADIPPDPWQMPYQYQSDGNEYQIWSTGPDRADGSGDEVYIQ
jgi:general secretion pathway protein G